MIAPSLVAEAATWLRGELANGPRLVAELERLGRDAGFGRVELLAAAIYLGLRSRGSAAARYWTFPERTQ